MPGTRRDFLSASAKSREVTSEFTPEGKWTFSATGRYVRMLVLLYEMTDEPQYLQWA